MAAHHPIVFKHTTLTLELISKIIHLNQHFRLMPLLDGILFKMPGDVLSSRYNLNQNVGASLVQHLFSNIVLV
jgi:hypothetical protein